MIVATSEPSVSRRMSNTSDSGTAAPASVNSWTASSIRHTGAPRPTFAKASRVRRAC